MTTNSARCTALTVAAARLRDALDEAERARLVAILQADADYQHATSEARARYAATTQALGPTLETP